MTARAAQAGIARGSTDYLVVFVTYLAAASLRAARQGVAAVKPELQSDANFTATALDAMDTVYLLSLGSVLIVSGAIGKMKGNLSCAIVGLSLSAASMAITGILLRAMTPASVAAATTQVAFAHGPLRAIDGFAQALAIPNVVAVASAFVHPAKMGVVLGAWMTSGPVGDVLAMQLASSFAEDASGGRWTSVYFVVAAAELTAALSLYACVDARASPSIRGEDDALLGRGGGGGRGGRGGGGDGFGEALPLLGGVGVGGGVGVERYASRVKSGWTGAVASIARDVREAWDIPGLRDWTLSCAFARTLVLSVLLWMPYYLSKTLGSQVVADNLVNVFAVAIAVGSVLAGQLMDVLYGRYAPAFACMFVLGASPLLALPRLEHATTTFALVLTSLGLFVAGPANTFWSGVCVDLAESVNKPRLVSTCVGVVGGVGILGSALGCWIVGRVGSGSSSVAAAETEEAELDAGEGSAFRDRWDNAFLLMFFVCLKAALSLSRLSYWQLRGGMGKPAATTDSRR